MIGKPPFDGNSQLQLFQNVLNFTELRFPEGSLKVLHPDFVELCRSLLRRNPVERLTFEEFFNHRFLKDPGVAVDAQLSASISRAESPILTDVHRPQLLYEHQLKAPDESLKQGCSSVNDDERDFRKVHGGISGTKDNYAAMQSTSTGKPKELIEVDPYPSNQIRVADSLESIEREYVLVHSNFASMEILTSSLGPSLKESSNSKACSLTPKNSEDQRMPIGPDVKENTSWSEMDQSTASGAPYVVREAHRLTVLHPSTRLQLLHQYVGALSDLAQEKLNAGCFMESFSVELIILAIWKEALSVCNSWLGLSRKGSDVPESSSGNETAGKGASSSSETDATTDISNPSSASIWAEQGFVLAYDRTEKLSKYLQDLDGRAEMPDAMEIIYQTALVTGRNGAADELIGNQESAATMYSKALLLFSFIVAEAPSLALNPPFSLAPDNKQQIVKYIRSLESRLSRSQMPKPRSKHLRFGTK